MPTTRNAHPSAAADRFQFHDLEPSLDSFRDAVIEGLGRPQKAIPCRFLYDERGSKLFDAICDQPEYYPTRTELRILERNAAQIAALVGPRAVLVELGSGASRKVRLLLDAFDEPLAYVPIDISLEHLRSASRRVAGEHRDIAVHAICADYGEAFDLPSLPATGARVAFFPGSTIGNFEESEATRFLATWGRRLGPGAHMIIGVDLEKDAAILDRAYDDAAGVTASFSRNLLVRANRELGATFHPDRFVHEARYVAERHRVEIHLRSLDATVVRVGESSFAFARDELLHVENSCKYSVPRFTALAEAAGFEVRRHWTDPRQLFSVHLLTVRRAGC